MQAHPAPLRREGRRRRTDLHRLSGCAEPNLARRLPREPHGVSGSCHRAGEPARAETSPPCWSLVLRAWLAVYRRPGRRRPHTAVADAIDATKRSGTGWHEDWSLTALGFLETSLGDYGAALNALEPLLSRYDPMSSPTEIFAASFVPDAVEALTALGRATRPNHLSTRLSATDAGSTVRGCWQSAPAAAPWCWPPAVTWTLRCGARGRALAEHDRLPMPFERARTQLLLGQLLRRDRSDATAMLRDALAVFEQLGTPLWADRARAELAGAGRRARRPAQDGLTPAEQRVAELAASGLTNRDVAATLFISSKTVEATLARVYRKLGIRSRAELGRHMNTIRNSG